MNWPPPPPPETIIIAWPLWFQAAVGTAIVAILILFVGSILVELTNNIRYLLRSQQPPATDKGGAATQPLTHGQPRKGL